MNRNRNRHWTPYRLAAPAAMLCAISVAGCHGRSVLDDPAAQKQAASSSERETLVLQAGKWETPPTPEPGTPHGDLELAEALFRAEDYKKAERAYEEVAEKHEKTPEVHERAIFMQAEAQFQQGLYAEARDGFEVFVKSYPGSKLSTNAMQRLFAIADTWLDEARSDIRRGKPGEFPGRFVNLDRGEKPLFDLDGHALQILKYVREQDPNGPLADDALMMEAGYHYAMGNYREADVLYDQLVHNYPHSEHQPQAHLLSAEAKMQAYKGSAYDSRKLEEARRTFRSAINQFPNDLERDRPRVYTELDHIRQEQAKAQFEVAEWYLRMEKPNSARIYYQWIQKNFPGTKWADRATERLSEMDQGRVAESQTVTPAAATETVSESKPKRESPFERVRQMFGRKESASHEQ